MMRPEHQHYDSIEQYFKQSISYGSDFLFDTKKFECELRRLSDKNDVPYEVLLSFIRNLHVVHVKRTAFKVKSDLPSLLEAYKKGSSIKELARKANYPPYLLARLVVESVTVMSSKNKTLAKAMRDPLQHLAKEDAIVEEYRGSIGFATAKQFALQIVEAIETDPLYGPLHDRERHFVGVEYELVLEHELQSIGVPFETEAQLRERGTSRTPDILLKSPLGVEVPKRHGDEGTEWKIVCWIDSKALFGDVNTHHFSVLPQAESYLHRYGPGMVLYWFGHAPLDRLGDSQGDVVILGWDVPRRFMLPTGKIITCGNGYTPMNP